MDTYSYAEVKKRIRAFRVREADWLKAPEAGADARLRDLFYSESAADMALFTFPGRSGKRIRKAHRDLLEKARQGLRDGEGPVEDPYSEMLAHLMSELICLRLRKIGVRKPSKLESDVNLRQEIRNIFTFKGTPLIRTGRIVLSNPARLAELSGGSLLREARALHDAVPAFRSFVIGELMDSLTNMEECEFRSFGRFRIIRTAERSHGEKLIFLSEGERFALIASGEKTLLTFTNRLGASGFELIPDTGFTQTRDFLCLTLKTGNTVRIATSREYLRTVNREMDLLVRHCWGKNVSALIDRLNQKGQILREEGRAFLVREDYREIDRMLTGKSYCFLLRLHPKKSKMWIEKKYYSRDINSSGKCLTDPESGSRLMRFQKLCSSRMGAVCRESDTYGSMAELK